MKFQKALHWADGLFLRQHHLQYLQNYLMSRDAQTRGMMFPYPFGLFDLELDQEALKNARVVVNNISAVMPDGTEVSMPGNAIVPSLDLQSGKLTPGQPVTILLAVPCYTAGNGNLRSSESVTEKRLFVAETLKLRDENDGSDETEVVVHRLNARLLTDQDDTSEMVMLPILRLLPQAVNVSTIVWTVDQKYVPPYILMSSTHPLFSRLQELKLLISQRRNKVLSDLVQWRYSPENFSGESGQLVIQLAFLNKYLGRFNSLFVPGTLTPFQAYVELRSVLGELSAFQPLRGMDIVSEYNHADCGPQFDELIVGLRSLLLADGENGCIRIDFTMAGEPPAMTASFNQHELEHAFGFYLAVTCENIPRQVVDAVEKGDNFRLIAPSALNKRIRGMKLIETRYPPRYFPALPDTLWFQLIPEKSPNIWEDIQKEQKMVMDWSNSVFPNLKASLFVALRKEEESEKHE